MVKPACLTRQRHSLHRATTRVENAAMPDYRTSARTWPTVKQRLLHETVCRAKQATMETRVAVLPATVCSPALCGEQPKALRESKEPLGAAEEEEVQLTASTDEAVAQDVNTNSAQPAEEVEQGAGGGEARGGGRGGAEPREGVAQVAVRAQPRTAARGAEAPLQCTS